MLLAGPLQCAGAALDMDQGVMIEHPIHDPRRVTVLQADTQAPQTEAVECRGSTEIGRPRCRLLRGHPLSLPSPTADR